MEIDRGTVRLGRLLLSLWGRAFQKCLIRMSLQGDERRREAHEANGNQEEEHDPVIAHHVGGGSRNVVQKTRGIEAQRA